MLSFGAMDAIEAHGSEEQRATWLSKLVSGEWAATMNLTEPQAGSDVGALATVAIKQPDGRYKIKGQKTFISYGDHNLTENIVHLVLARTPGSSPGTRGVSLFLVPKFHLDDRGAPTLRNDVRCASIEHKLGIHGSPTCTMVLARTTIATAILSGRKGRACR